MRVLAAACVVLGLATVAWASGAGVDEIYNRTDRLASPAVPASVDSTVLRVRTFAFWHGEPSEGERYNLDLEQEAYALQAADGTGLIDLSLLKLHPRYRRDEAHWGVDVGALALDVTRNDALYAAVPQDDRDQFVLPTVIVDVKPRRLLLRVGFWQEYEVLPLNPNIYAFTVARVAALGGGLQITPDAVARVEVRQTRRFYPESFALERGSTLAEYRLQDPLDAGPGGLWREFSMEAAQQHYPVTGESFVKVTAGSLLRFDAIGATHFVLPQLEYADSYVVYGPGTAPETLLEYTVKEPDAVLRLKYEGFTRLGASPWIVAWGLTAESSVVQTIQRGVVVHAKVEYTY